MQRDIPTGPLPLGRSNEPWELSILLGRHRDLGGQLVELLPRLRRFAMVLARTPDAADDLVQAAVTRALERQSQWEPGTRLDRWMFQIMKSVWLNNRGSALVRHTEPLDDHSDVGALDGAAAMEAQLTLEEVRVAFTLLPMEHRQALLLVNVEGYFYKEAADLLDVPIGTVINRIARGRVALAEKALQANRKVVVLHRNRG
jgi:RNA polymerase sigma-70 factor (ECF subfamily)